MGWRHSCDLIKSNHGKKITQTCCRDNVWEWWRQEKNNRESRNYKQRQRFILQWYRSASWKFMNIFTHIGSYKFILSSFESKECLMLFKNFFDHATRSSCVTEHYEHIRVNEWSNVRVIRVQTDPKKHLQDFCLVYELVQPWHISIYQENMPTESIC